MKNNTAMNTPYFHTITETEVLPAPMVVPSVDPAIREQLLEQVDECGQVTVRCHLHTDCATMLRIWTNTYLVCRQTGHRSRMIYADGITYMPAWMPVPAGTTTFILVFETLPDKCEVFDLLEDIPETGGFHVPGVLRNGRDMYDVFL